MRAQSCYHHHLLLLILLVSATSSFLVSSIAKKESGFCSSEEGLPDSIQMAHTLGGLKPSSEAASNSAEIDDLARFAVDEHNKKENALLEFVRVVKAQEQVVAGKLHHLTVEAVDAGKKKIYEAKVWVKPWMNFKELQEFKHAGEDTTSTPDVGGQTGCQSVPVHDPMVQDAASHAIKHLQQRSNSLSPYELKEVVHAKTEVVDDIAKFSMVLKLQRGGKEEKFKFDVHKDSSGAFHVNKMEQDRS